VRPWGGRRVSSVAAGSCSAPGSQCLAKLDEAWPLGDLFVQADGGRVGLVGQPVHLGAASRPGRGIDVLDQLAADTLATLCVIDVQVLQVASVLDAPAGAMIDPVDHAYRLAVAPGEGRMGWLVGIED